MMAAHAARRFGGALVLSALVHLAVAAGWLHERPAAADPAPAPSPGMSGDTFDLGAGESPPESVTAAQAEEDPAPGAAETPSAAASPAQARLAPAPGQVHEASTLSAAPSLYGAVGERSAVDLVPAFQRAFAQTASADPAWQGAALGSAGKTSLAITLDDSGHIAATSLGGGASSALGSSIQRTLALLAHRAFVARGARTILQLSAVVAGITADTAHDGQHGDRFALGVGETAWFALPSGRRIDLHVTTARAP